MRKLDGDLVHRMTLREAARRTARSITTLRRYIRSGRLAAEKRMGRYGPEYFISSDNLNEAGLTVEQSSAPVATTDAGRSRGPTELAPRPDRETVPMSLFQDLQMKHEQLLVQYGMVRAGGLRMMELQSELETRDRELQHLREELARLRRAPGRVSDRLRRELRRANLELEGRAMEIAALKEKVRGLEMVSRNAVTNETIDEQFERLFEQSRRVDSLDPALPLPEEPLPGPETDH